MARAAVVLRLMRHAQTPMNARKEYLGWTDDAIIAQDFPVQSYAQHTIIGSDLLRCRQTAAAYFPHATYIKEPRLRELDFGDFEGKTYAQLQHNAAYCAWLDDPYAPVPNGENFADFLQRVYAGFLTNARDKTIIMTHGGVVRALLQRFAPQEHPYWHYSAGHEQVYTLIWQHQQDFEEARRCTYLLEEHIAAKPHMSKKS